MDAAWQSNNIPTYSIPTFEAGLNGGNKSSWNGNAGCGGRYPRRGGEPPRRSGRSRSPGRGNGRNGEAAWQSHNIAPDSEINIPTPDSEINIPTYSIPGRGNGRKAFRRSQNPGNNIYVSGLSPRVKKSHLVAAFERFGKVKDVRLIMMRNSSVLSRGFGFVRMETCKEADAAITALNATDLMGQTLIVEKARGDGPLKRECSTDVSLGEHPYNHHPYDNRYGGYGGECGYGGGSGYGGYDWW